MVDIDQTDRVVRTDDGAELATSVLGDGDGPTVLLAHCWLGARVVWAQVAQRLHSSGHRVVLYDQRGHGASTLGHDPISVSRLGRDVAEVARQLELEDVVVAGHSMGGFSVQSYAIEHPEDLRTRVRGLTLVATAAHGVGRVPMQGLTTWILGSAASTWMARRPFALGMTRRAFGEEPRDEDVATTRDLYVQTPPRVRAGCFRAFDGMDMRAGLPLVDVPVAVVSGSLDLLTPPALGRAIADHLPAARYELLEGMGHMLPMEAPDRVSATIAELAGPAG